LAAIRRLKNSPGGDIGPIKDVISKEIMQAARICAALLYSFTWRPGTGGKPGEFP
jgi:hypothetical protein